MKTLQPKKIEVKRAWHHFDAKDQVLGRLATKVAGLLMGKGKSNYATQMDMGDYVVITNAEKIKVTGRKTTQKLYRRHSGYPGGFKELAFDKMMIKNPTRILELAISGMLPENRLKKFRMARLNVVAGDANPFEKNFTKEQ
jgi:large subunit ribosomal protein L13